MPGRGLDPDGVRRDELAPHQHGPEQYLDSVEEVVTNYDDGGPTRGPTFARGYRFYHRNGGARIKPGVQSCKQTCLFFIRNSVLSIKYTTHKC